LEAKLEKLFKTRQITKNLHNINVVLLEEVKVLKCLVGRKMLWIRVSPRKHQPKVNYEQNK